MESTTTSSGSSRKTSSETSMDSAAAVPPTAAATGGTQESTTSKLKMLLNLLRRFIGVDMAAVRFSLPAQLLEPIPNLEYWNYIDFPAAFVSIGDSDNDLSRFLSVLRFWFSKDLKYVKGKPCKPYNSLLGEFFRCTWDVDSHLTAPIATPKSEASRPSSANQTKLEQNEPIRLSYLTEQTSHHPPVSAFVIDCPTKGITARGYDHISAKFSGTSIKVTAGSHNLGIFITLHNRAEEEYRLTHPAAYLGGLLRGSLSVSVTDVCFVTCARTKLKALLHYVEEPWIGKMRNRVEGVIYEYEPTPEEMDGHSYQDSDSSESSSVPNQPEYARLRDVPADRIRVKIEGNWMEKIYYYFPSAPNDKYLLLDVIPLFPEPKTVPGLDEQLPNESRQVWKEVTKSIVTKDYGKATALKQGIEEKQRERATEREKASITWIPRYFEHMESKSLKPGKPDLTAAGEEVLRGLNDGNYKIESSVDSVTAWEGGLVS